MALLVTIDGGLSIAASPSGGISSVYRVPSAASTNNAALIAAGQHQVYYLIAYNAATTIRYIKLYNKATQPDPTVDTPVLTVPVPAGGGIALDIHLGLNLFPLGVGVAMTQGAADNDNTALAAGDIVGLNVGYE